MNPVEDIKKNRDQARLQLDPNADLCFLSLASIKGEASIRTLVLRNINDNRFSLFINQSSPKWKILSEGGSYQLLIWYPSCQKQYRISGDHQILKSDFVNSHWQKRPVGNKYMDLLYETISPQSSDIDSRDSLVNHINSLKNKYNVYEMEAPGQVTGVELIASSIEILDLSREDNVHDRQIYFLKNGAWTAQTLIP